MTNITKSSACTAANEGNIPWIIDSCAFDHMTRRVILFTSYFPSSGHHKVCITNGILALQAEKELFLSLKC